jgi:DNA (cytosine-5)-methyltransferase 1
MLKVLDLFSGIGGFSLGLERAGFRTIAFCEIDSFCRRVLAKHWPDVPCHDDIMTREFQEGEADVICGGFPCQDISVAGKGAGLAGERSGLFRELVRAIRLVRPRFAILENVAALLGRGMGAVLGDLAEIGFDAEWHCIQAAEVGAPHKRDRVWIVAYADGERPAQPAGSERQSGVGPVVCCEVLGDAHRAGLAIGQADQDRQPFDASSAAERTGSRISHADGQSPPRLAIPWGERREWVPEPDVGRVADGIPARVDRLRGLGNAVVPQIPELIGRAILASEAA